MNVKLYKFTPHLKEFIDKPMLSCTFARELNDPFELEYSEEFIQTAKNHFDKAYLFEDMERFLQIQDSRTGVISLSEEKYNPLMWSHYSNEHKGGIIEFTFEVEFQFNRKLQRGFFKNLADNHYWFDRVKYRLDRDSDLPLVQDYSKVTSGELRKHIGFIKADCWNYEKEHRFLCPTMECDQLLYLEKKEKKEKISHKLLQQFGKNSFEFIDGGGIKINHRKVDYFKFVVFLNEIESLYGVLPKCFFEINPSCVTGIFFGTRVNRGSIDEIFSSGGLEKFINLGDSISQAVLSKRRYEILFEKVTNYAKMN